MTERFRLSGIQLLAAVIAVSQCAAISFAGEPEREFEPLPVTITSFGGAIAGDRIYVYGGHNGAAHSYSKSGQNRILYSIPVDGGKWKKAGTGPNLQGLAMVPHGDSVIRIGGFSARNAEGEDHDLWSQTDVARFSPEDESWSTLPSLPEPRSSHDAAILDGQIYVIGGWKLAGEDDSTWHKTAWSLDLNAEKPEWKAIPEPPFQRRALAVAAHDGKIYAIGGMTESSGTTTKVDIYDPAARKWTEGPAIHGEGRLGGFGSSAFAAGKRLYVSTIDGSLQRLSSDGSSWEKVTKTKSARFFHRLLPLNSSTLVMVGGANMSSGKFDELEVIDLTVFEDNE